MEEIDTLTSEEKLSDVLINENHKFLSILLPSTHWNDQKLNTSENHYAIYLQIYTCKRNCLALYKIKE